jgi:hypothetical protein
MNVLSGGRGRVRALLAVVAGTAGLAVGTPPATAVDPDTFGDDPNAGTTLREAIAATPAGGSIALQAGTYELTGAALAADKDLTISGAGMDATTVKGSGTDGVFAVTGSLTISGLTVTGGRKLTGAISVAGGGGFTVGSYGTATNGHLIARRVKVTGNTAKQGAGVYVTLSAPPRSSAEFTDSVIVGNTATDPDTAPGRDGLGGGISAYGDVTLDRTAVVGNAADYGGGLNMWVNPKSTLRATNVTIGANTAAFNGGGVINGGDLTFDATTFAGNVAVGGPNVLNNGGALSVGSTIFAGAGRTCQTVSGTTTSRGFNIEEGTGCLAALASSDRRGVGADGLALVPMDVANKVYWFRLGPPSLARDTGPVSCALAVDQRGGPRPLYDRCDIGAIEEETVPVPPTPTPTPSPTPTSTPRPSPTPRPTATPTPTPFPVTVYTPTPTPTPTPGGGVGGEVVTGGVAGRIATTGNARVQRRGSRVSVRTGLTVRCPAGGASCAAAATVRRGRTALGTTRVRVKPGRSAALAVRLAGTGAAALRRGATVRLRIVVTVRRAGATTVDRSRTVRLKA